MAKLTLSDLSSLTNQSSAISTINANSALIETALENTLSRDGTSPNTMDASLDMNNNRILNLPAPVADQEPLRLVDGQPLVDDAEAAQAAAEAALAAIQDFWLGNQTGDPTTDLDASALEGGELYYNTVTKRLRVYSLGTGWADVAPFEDMTDIAAYVALALSYKNDAETYKNAAASSASDADADRIAAQAAQTAASASAASASTSASNAATAETNAETAETNAELAQAAAELAAANAAASFDSFDDRYLGEKGTTPTLDNDGNALVPGALYYDTGSTLLKYYNGTIWSTLSTAAGLNEVVDDITPQLGGNLDLNSKNITGTGNISITGDVSVTDEVYDATNWNASTEVPTKNAVRDKIEEILGTTLPAAYQPLDADLTALAALSTTGILSRTAANTYTPRTITGTANEVTVANGDGVSGNPTISLPDDVTVTTLTVTDDAYAVGWNGSSNVPTKNAVYDKIEAIDAAKQPLDTDLTDIAAIAPSNDDIIQRKTGAWTNRTMAQLITDLAALGTTFQPLDSDLTDIAALSTTAAGRSILVYTDPNADRIIFWDDSAGGFVSLTLPTGLSISGTTLSFADGPRGEVALSDGATPALDASLGNVFTLVAAGNRTIAVPTNPVAGQKIIIRHEASGGARTLALNTGAGGFRFGTDITALSETTSGAMDYIGCIYNSVDSKWDVVAYSKGF